MARDLWEIGGAVKVTRRGEQRVRRGHPWIYRSDLKSEVDPNDEPGFARVEAPGGGALGTAFYSPRSEITLRMVSRGDALFTRVLFVQRFADALERRRGLLRDADAFRVVHGEADFLPGLFIDKYGDCVALQTTCAAADRLEPEFVGMVVEALRPRAVVIRDDSGTRAREGLERHVTVVVGESPVRATYHEGDIELEVDLLEDQKTGGYLDQCQNHVAARRYAGDEALDCFTYHGGFALQLARAGARVTAVDMSASALARLRQNAERNGVADLAVVESNVFDLLPRLLSEGRRFDCVVLDPPAFAAGKKTTQAAARAYKEINLRAMRLLRPGGILITCSCSGRIRPDDFDATLHAAARDAHRHLHVIERRTAGPDHPVLVGVPETDYLKVRVLMVL